MTSLIINVQDEQIGSWHQITVDRNQDSINSVRLDGQLIRIDHPLALAAKRIVCEWDDFFEGCTDKEQMCDQVA